MLAVAELALCFPQTKIIITSYPFHRKIKKISAIREELELLSVLKNRIILEKISTNTLSQIEESVKIIYKKEIKKVVFITNEYHIPRLSTIYKNFESLASPDKKTKRIVQEIKCSGTRVEFIAAEAILPYRDKKYIKIINHLKKSPAYQKRIQNEERGLSMIKSGQYGLKKTLSARKSERKMCNNQ